MASKYRHEAKTKLAPEFRPTLPIDFAIPFIYGDLLRLYQQLQLFGRYRFIGVLAASGVWTGFLEESLYKWESYMPDLCCTNERRICCPIEPCDWPCDEARVKRKQLVDQCQAVSFLNHPLDLRGSACHTGKMNGNPYFGKHLDQSGMSRRMQFRISEYGEPGRNFMDIQLRTVREMVIGAHAHN